MFKRKGQSTLEYALIIAVVVAGLMIMQHYVKRGFAGRLKGATDDMGEQFDPVSYEANFDVYQESNTRQIVQERDTNTEHIGNQISSRTGNEKIEAYGTTEELFSR